MILPVQVATEVGHGGVASRRGRAARGRCRGHGNRLLGRMRDALGVHRALVVIGLDARHGQKAQSLAVPSGLESSRLVIVDGEITNVGVATEELNRRVGLDSSDGVKNSLERAAALSWADRVVPDDQVNINRLAVIDSAQKPGLLDHGRGLGDD